MSMLNEKRAEELLALTTKMIQAPSYSGQENLVVDVMKKFCDEHKFTDIHVDRYGNCICHIKGSKPGPKILFDGHMDTVPVPDKTKWDHDPFGAEIVDGRMYGRGTSDMKGACPPCWQQHFTMQRMQTTTSPAISTLQALSMRSASRAWLQGKSALM